MNTFKHAIANNSQSATKRFASSKTIFQPRKPSVFNPRSINNNNDKIFNSRLTPNFRLHYGNQKQKFMRLVKSESVHKKNIIKMHSETSAPDPLKFKPMSNSQKQNLNKTMFFNAEQKTSSKPFKETTIKEVIDHAKKTIAKESSVRIFVALIIS